MEWNFITFNEMKSSSADDLNLICFSHRHYIPTMIHSVDALRDKSVACVSDTTHNAFSSP